MPRLALARAWLAIAASTLTIAACSSTPSPPPSTNSAPSGPAISAARSARAKGGPTTTAASDSAAEPTSPAPAVTTETLPPVVVATVTPRKPSGKTAKLKWGQGLCDNSGSYDTGRFTEAELQDSIKLFQSGWGAIVDDKTTRANLDADFDKAFDEIRALKIVSEPAWEAHRAAKLTEMQQSYQLAVSEVEYRTNPQRLRANPSFAACQRWAEPLMANDEATLIAAWRLLASELLAKPGASRVWSEVDAASKQPGAGARARKEVMAFGWHNCVNERIVRATVDQAELEKLLTKVKHDCEH